MYDVKQKKINSANKRLACALVETAFRENDYWFFVSRFGQSMLQEMPEKVQLKAKDFCVRFKREKAEVTRKGIEAARSLVDDNFLSVMNMFVAGGAVK